MLFPLVKQGPGRPFLLGIITAAITISLLVFVTIGLLGVDRASQLTYPVYTAIQEVAIGEVLVNLHSIISVILLVLIFIKLLILVYGASETLRQVLKPRTRWPHFLSLTIFISALAQSMYANPIQNGEWSERYSFFYNACFTLALPALLLAATWIRRGSQKQS
jgi:spore germination protein KB